MNRERQVAAALLVTADLAWVHQTGTLHPAAALGLAVLAAAAPFCAVLRRLRAWRLGWNAALGAAFLLLIQDVLAGGAEGLLGGGVLLAMTCQIHLLHAGDGTKRADLLTFNSVLIALVAGQAAESGGFAVFGTLWLCALVAFLAVEASPARTRRRLLVRRSLQAAGLAAGTLLALGLLVPEHVQLRDAGDANSLGWSGRAELGSEARIDLRRFQPPRDETAVLFRVVLRSGARTDVPSHWREAVMEHQDGPRFLQRHVPRSGSHLGIGSTMPARGRLERDAGATVARATVELVTHRGATLPAPLELAEIAVPLDGYPDLLHATGDGVVRRPTPPDAPRDALGYELGWGAHTPPVDSGTPADRAPYVRIDVEDPSAVPAVLHDLVRAALRGAGDDVRPMDVVARCRDHLAAGFSYARPGEPGAAVDFAAFLNAEGGGHCEYFATALALMLRLRGVPCRIVTGFLVHEWDASLPGFLVRARDAHAWVEVLDVAAGRWQTADATPEASGMSTAPTSQEQVFTVSALAILAGLASWLVRRRRREPVAARRIYLRAVHSAGLRRAPQETPRELLTRAAGTIRADRWERLRAATAAHERARFGASAEEHTG